MEYYHKVTNHYLPTFGHDYAQVIAGSGTYTAQKGCMGTLMHAVPLRPTRFFLKANEASDKPESQYIAIREGSQEIVTQIRE